jgi:anti-anti-sigma factor
MSATRQTILERVDYPARSLEEDPVEDDMADFQVDPGSDGVLYLSGEFDMAVAEGFAADAVANLDGQRDLVLDVSELAFIDSMGIRALLQLARLAAPKGVVLRRPRANVERVLEIVDIESLGISVER